MAKELYFNETDCENLNVLNILPKETALELWKMSLQILDSNHNLSSKQLTKAASKIAFRHLIPCLIVKKPSQKVPVEIEHSVVADKSDPALQKSVVNLGGDEIARRIKSKLT